MLGWIVVRHVDDFDVELDPAPVDMDVDSSQNREKVSLSRRCAIAPNTHTNGQFMSWQVKQRAEPSIGTESNLGELAYMLWQETQSTFPDGRRTVLGKRAAGRSGLSPPRFPPHG